MAVRPPGPIPEYTGILYMYWITENDFSILSFSVTDALSRQLSFKEKCDTGYCFTDAGEKCVDIPKGGTCNQIDVSVKDVVLINSKISCLYQANKG